MEIYVIITFSRSSSINNFDYCQQQYFLVYNLGYANKAGIKADLGTAAHKVLEWLAIGKQFLQQNPNSDVVKIEDFIFNTTDWYDKFDMSTEHIKRINKLRSAKTIYKWDCLIPENHQRFGQYLVDFLIKEACQKYSIELIKDIKTVSQYVWIALDYKDGIYDPRKRNIFSPEQNFDIPIVANWANFSYNTGGEKISGNFSIKGTIDLITQLDDDTLEIIDWKGLPTSTLLPTPNGWVTMGNVNVGDILFDIDGNTTKVLNKSQKSYKPCYKIVFNDNVEVICDNEHLWYLSDGSVKPITSLVVGDKIPVARHLVKDNIDRIITKIQLCGVEETQCIMVDSPTNTYLCTENMIPTHNTGQRKNWATGEEKDHTKLCEDTQLMLYYYAARKLFPQFKNIYFTIFFMRDGGPFPIIFEEHHEKIFLDKIEKHFHDVQNTTIPKLINKEQSDFRCTRLCPFFKNMQPGTNQNICRHIHNEIHMNGIEYVIETYKNKDFEFGKYEAPG